MYAVVKVNKMPSSRSASSKSVHILRDAKEYEHFKAIAENIILNRPTEKFSNPKKDSVNTKDKNVDKKRQEALKKVNTKISRLETQIDTFLSKDEQKYIDEKKEELKAQRKNEREHLVGEERKNAKAVIEAIENNLETKRDDFITNLAQDAKGKVTKIQEKIKDLFKERDILKNEKEVPETRGRNQNVKYIEFVFGLTGVTTKDKNINAEFEATLSKFLTDPFFKGMETTTGSIHLDQSYLHAHVLFKIPENTTWDKYLKKHIKDDGRKVYKAISNAWHKRCKKSGLEELIGDEFIEHQVGNGKDYIKSLQKWKDTLSEEDNKKHLERLQAQNDTKQSKDTPKQEKINPRADMSYLEPSKPTRIDELLAKTLKIKSDIEKSIADRGGAVEERSEKSATLPLDNSLKKPELPDSSDKVKIKKNK